MHDPFPFTVSIFENCVSEIVSEFTFVDDKSDPFGIVHDENEQPLTSSVEFGESSTSDADSVIVRFSNVDETREQVASVATAMNGDDDFAELETVTSFISASVPEFK
jgi:hypothetical protein